MCVWGYHSNTVLAVMAVTLGLLLISCQSYRRISGELCKRRILYVRHKFIHKFCTSFLMWLIQVEPHNHEITRTTWSKRTKQSDSQKSSFLTVIKGTVSHPKMCTHNKFNRTRSRNVGRRTKHRNKQKHKWREQNVRLSDRETQSMWGYWSGPSTWHYDYWQVIKASPACGSCVQ